MKRPLLPLTASGAWSGDLADVRESATLNEFALFRMLIRIGRRANYSQIAE